ncbi:MAG: hypothetical protein IKN81_00645 [Oscillospiraceae bacterium]|nr:hypothetical protein [Oscillospiraceae bacterium]
MYPLIEIKSIPIEIRMKTTHASLEYTRGTAEMEISRSDKGLDIKSRPIKLQVDTYESRSGSIPQGTSAPLTTQGITAVPQADRQAAYEATSAYSDQGQIMLNARIGQELNRQNRLPGSAPAPAEENPVELETGLAFEWEDGQMEIRYEMDKMSFDWKIDRGSFEFTPGDIELIVEQRPSVTFKYMGGPIYVPRSADPNYGAVDVKA